MLRKSPAKSTLTPSKWEQIKNFLKTHKVISRGLSHLATYDALKKYSAPLNLASQFAESQGYGKKRKRRNHRGGRKTRR